MKMSQEESAHLWFIKELEIGHVVRVPCLKGKGRVVELSDTVCVHMLDGPYIHHRFEVEWSNIARLS